MDESIGPDSFDEETKLSWDWQLDTLAAAARQLPGAPGSVAWARERRRTRDDVGMFVRELPRQHNALITHFIWKCEETVTKL